MRLSGHARWGLTAAVVAGLALAPAAAAQTYTYADVEQTYSVPAGVTGVHVVLVGAAGSADPNVSGVGAAGAGAKLTADVPVPPGTTTLYVEVGGVGVPANPPGLPSAATGGFNGGGGGPFGGGGATDVRTVSCMSACAAGGGLASLDSRLAVAGGGGGPGAESDGGSAGVDSSGSGAAGDTPISGTGAASGFPGQPVDQTIVTPLCIVAGGTGGELGYAGALGEGGAGGYLFISGANSGGGGGGLYGGGGGAQCYASGAAAILYSGAGGAGSSGTVDGRNVALAADPTEPASATITAPVPTPMAPPAILGETTVGATLTASHGTWTSSLPISGYTDQWERCDAGGGSCTPIGGADRPTYTVQSGDLGHTLRVQETAANFYGPSSTPAISPPFGPIAAAATPPTNPGSGTNPGHGASPRTPVLSRLRVSPRRFVVVGRLVHGRCERASRADMTHAQCRRAIRLTVGYRLSAAVTTTFTFTRMLRGHIVGHRCVTQSAAETSRHARCRRSRPLRGTIVRAGAAGTDRFTFHGRVGGRELGPGNYRLIATPAGGRPRTATFTIRR